MRRFLAPLLIAWLAIGLASAEAQVTPGCISPPANTACAQIQGFVASAKTTLAVSSASSNVALPATGSTLNVLIQNTGSTDANLVLGLTNGTVATTSNPMLSAGQWMWLPQGSNAYLAAITASSTTNLTIWSGSGPPAVVYANGTVTLAAGTSVTISGPVTTTPAATRIGRWSPQRPARNSLRPT